MSKKKKIPAKDQIWIDARKRFHLSDIHIQMARELSLNPKKFGKLANDRQEPWKAPLPEFIEDIYFKRFKKEKPDTIKSVEHFVKDRNRKREGRKRLKIEFKAIKTDD
jgi:hypothetical protein